MHFRSCISAVGIALLLAACSSATDANKDNFTKAINGELAKKCVTVNPGGTLGGGGPTYPNSQPLAVAGGMRSAEDAQEANKRHFGQFDALVSAGLLTVADADVKPMFGKTLVPGKVYSLTAVGKTALRDPKYKAFCAGHYKVDQVVKFTQPGNAMGTTISEVNFTYSATDVPSWATSDEMKAAFPSMAEHLAPGQKGRATMVLNNDGWGAELPSF